MLFTMPSSGDETVSKVACITASYASSRAVSIWNQNLLDSETTLLKQGLASSLAERLQQVVPPRGAPLRDGRLLAAVGESCLVPLLVKQLGTASFADMCSRYGPPTLFACVMGLPPGSSLCSALIIDTHDCLLIKLSALHTRSPSGARTLLHVSQLHLLYFKCQGVRP